MTQLRLEKRLDKLINLVNLRGTYKGLHAELNYIFSKLDIKPSKFEKQSR